MCLAKSVAPTYKRVRELFDYRDGMLFWKTSPCCNIKPGYRAGGNNGRGYRGVAFDGMKFLEHRIIFLWHHGYWPENGVDHINRCRDDNRIENLREVSKSCNALNCVERVNNTSGVIGVSFDNECKSWLSQLILNGKRKYLGRSKDLTKAVILRWEAEVKHGIDSCLSSSAYSYLDERGLIDHESNCVRAPSQATSLKCAARN